MRRGIVISMFREVNVLTYGGLVLWLWSSVVIPARVAFADAVVAPAPSPVMPSVDALLEAKLVDLADKPVSLRGG